jgi:hypothetical protein
MKDSKAVTPHGDGVPPQRIIALRLAFYGKTDDVHKTNEVGESAGD